MCAAKLKEDCPVLPGLLLSGLVIVIVGLIDDTRGLPGKVKLLGQIVAASILIINLAINGIADRKYSICSATSSPSAGCLCPLTMIWLLGAINALNLLDGIDGLATMLGIILSCTIAAMAVVTGNYGVVIIAMVFASSLMGFMRFNFPPATIFLGDTGQHVNRFDGGCDGHSRFAQRAGHGSFGGPLGRMDHPFLRCHSRRHSTQADRQEHLCHGSWPFAPSLDVRIGQQPQGARLGGRLLRDNRHGDLGGNSRAR